MIEYKHYQYWGPNEEEKAHTESDNRQNHPHLIPYEGSIRHGPPAFSTETNTGDQTSHNTKNHHRGKIGLVGARNLHRMTSVVVGG